MTKFSAGDDSGLLNGMGTEPWIDPLAPDEYCARCSIIVMSTGLNSFDADQLGEVAGIPGLALGDIVASTDAIGVNESLVGVNAVVGNSGSAGDDSECTPKLLTNFSDIKGICPEMPSLEGSYHIAGLASWAQTNDLRPENAMPDVQRVNTYTIALAESLPSFLFQTEDSSKIGIVPACKSSKSNLDPWSDCSIVDAKVVAKTDHYTRIDIAWEDSHWGNDYDMDGIATIEVCTATGTSETVRAACFYDGAMPVPTASTAADGVDKRWETAAAYQLQVRVSVPQAYAGNALEFGVILGGTTRDGLLLNAPRSGGNDYSCLQAGVCVDKDGADGADNMVWAAPVRLDAGVAGAQFLENPLWYAAKYGNFRNSDSKNAPTERSEWDAVDLDGKPFPDGVPDAYFPVSNPGQLAQRLNRIVQVIKRNAASGSSVAVTLERRDGVGATFQAYYFPTYREPGSSRQVSWVGGLHALFLDGDLNLREDSNKNGQLDDTDSKIQIFYDGENTMIQRIDSVSGAVTGTVPFTDIQPIWDAKYWLANLTDDQAAQQRVYNMPEGRHIFTWMDQLNSDGEVDVGEVVPFDMTHVIGDETSRKYRVLGVADVPAGQKLLNYVRGVDQPEMRSRTVRLPGGAQPQVWRLGDIVHSSPVVVGYPGAKYSVEYEDDSYLAYRYQYLNRRQVVYVGGNDGMVHAFNAGFYDNGAFRTAANDPVTGQALTEYALGAELWAYVPRNLLPHLRWLSQKDYPHVFYVDGEPRAYDVNIFTPDATHPGGWGTILVVGFRLGGGEIDMDLDADGNDDFTGRSAYVILDITDPEQAPTLLAEISHPNLGYTTAVPTLLKGREVDLTTGSFEANDDAWYLVMGSGPYGNDSASRQAALKQGVSSQHAQLFVYDLVARSFVDLDSATDGVQAALDTGVDQSFVGNLTSEDWNRDYLDDAVYFGLIEGIDPKAPKGRLSRLRFELKGGVNVTPYFSLDATPLRTLLNPGLPFQGAPVTYRNLTTNREWVLAGTGRFLTGADNATNYANRFYGVLEPLGDNGDFNYLQVAENSLADTTHVQVLSNETVYDGLTLTTPASVKTGAGVTSVATYSELLTATRDAGGWYNELGPLNLGTDVNGIPIVSAESRNYNGAIALSTGVGFVKYATDGALCAPSGFSGMRFVDARSGTASRGLLFAELAAPVSFNLTADVTLLSGDSDIRAGAIAPLTALRTKDGIAVISVDNNAVQRGDKLPNLPPLSARQSWRELPIYP